MKITAEQKSVRSQHLRTQSSSLMPEISAGFSSKFSSRETALRKTAEVNGGGLDTIVRTEKIFTDERYDH